MFGVVLSPGSALNNHTGSWRTETPEVVTLGAPCSVSCQAGESVREWITALQWGQEDKAYEAWASIIRANPLPATMGRICYAPCQKMCTRSALGGSLEIQSMERVLGDFGLDREWEAPTPDNLTSFRTAVVGSGPCGLSAAHQLRQAGHQVTLFDARALPGGMLQYSISENRLPKQVLQAEINRLLHTGIEFVPHHAIRRVTDLLDKYDGVVWAAGASMCLAIMKAETVWNQPIHTGGRSHRTCTLSIGRGRAAAIALAAHLQETEMPVTPQAPTATIDSINTWYFNASSPTLPADQAPETEQESDVFNSDTDLGSGSVHGSLEADSALTFLGTESGRCLSCGSCFFCDNCYIACPDSAIVKSNGTYFVNGDYCKGCGICAEECPTGAITMIPVQN